MQGWHEFFGAEVGASAALAGLLFVALSINIARIIGSPWLVPRAAQSVAALVIALLLASIALVPATLNVQGTVALIVMMSGTAFAVGATIQQANVPKELRRYAIANAFANLPLYASGLIGAAYMLGGRTVGIDFLAFTVCYALFYGMYNSWVLLVEILR